MLDHSHVRLGRKAHNPARLMLAPQISSQVIAALPKPPTCLDRRSVPVVPALCYNDQQPDCTAVALLNYLLAFTGLLGEPRLNYQKDAVLSFFAACVGLPPWATFDQIAQTDGAEMLTVLKQQHDQGFDCGDGNLYHGDFGTFDPHDLNAVAAIVNCTGGLNTGVDLALSDQRSEIWDTDTPASVGDPTPGSWGGHDLLLWDYEGWGETDLLTWFTWGIRKQSTVRWFKSRVAEVHGMVWQQCMPASGKTWLGLTYDQLRLAA